VDLLRLGAIIRRRFLLLIAGVAIAALLSFAVSSVLPRTYMATATLLVFQTSNVGNVQLGDLMTSERLAATYANLLTRHPVLTQTIAELHLATTPDALARQINVDLVRDTQLLEVHVEDHDPAQAAAIANKLVAVFVDQVTTLQKQSFVDVQSHVDADLASNEAQLQATQQQLDALKAVANPTAAQRADLIRLTALLAQYNTTRDNLLRSAAAIRETEATSSTTLQLAESADVPRDPVFPRLPLNVGLAALVGLLLAAALAWLLEYLDDTVKSPDAVQTLLALPTLAQVRRTGRAPTRRVRSPGLAPGAGADALLARDAARSEAAESYRLLRTNIEFSAVDQPPRRLLVTSAVPGEGKSTVAANLAVVLAQSGKRVLLVDGDLRRPSIGRMFGLPPGRGLTTVLADATQSASHPGPGAGPVPAPGVEHLMLLPSGPLPPNPADLLGSQRMAAVLDELATAYDILVLDSPPVLVATDPLLLASRVDGVLLVVSTGETRSPLVRQAAESIRQVGGRLLGVVLNKVAASEGHVYYTYYQSGDPTPPPAEPVPAEAPPRPDGSRPAPGALARRP